MMRAIRFSASSELIPFFPHSDRHADLASLIAEAIATSDTSENLSHRAAIATLRVSWHRNLRRAIESGQLRLIDSATMLEATRYRSKRPETHHTPKNRCCVEVDQLSAWGATQGYKFEIFIGAESVEGKRAANGKFYEARNKRVRDAYLKFSPEQMTSPSKHIKKLFPELDNLTDRHVMQIANGKKRRAGKAKA